MKTNKKALMGMFMAMVLSMGAMGSISQNHEDLSTTQVGIGCGYMAGSTEGGASGAWNAASNVCTGAAGGMAAAGAAASVVSTTNPVGWGYWAVTGLVAL